MQVCLYFCPTCSVSILRTTIARKSRRSSFFLYAKRHGARLVSGIMKFWLPSKRYSFSINDYHCFNLVTFSTQWRDLVDSLLRNLKFSWIVWCWGERKSVQILCLLRFINNIYTDWTCWWSWAPSKDRYRSARLLQWRRERAVLVFILRC